MLENWLIPIRHARSQPNQPGRKSPLLLEHGSMTLRFYAPKKVDDQTPHTQDEIYIVASGRGKFYCGPNEQSLQHRDFSAGDAIFVPAGFVHRFADFTDDFATWVIFWGPQGGERQAERQITG